MSKKKQNVEYCRNYISMLCEVVTYIRRYCAGLPPIMDGIIVKDYLSYWAVVVEHCRAEGIARCACARAVDL